MKPYGLVALLQTTLVLAGITPIAAAHGGLFRGPTPGAPTSVPPPTNPNSPSSVPGGVARSREIAPVPGSAPSLAFSDERWEFWWEFNHDSFIDLRPRLLHVASSAGVGAFAPFDAAGRAQVLLPALIELLRDKDEQVRSATTYSLARLQDPSVLPYLANAALNDTSNAVRTNAVVALGLSRIPKAAERLKAILLDDHVQDEVRTFAAVALGVNGCAEASAALRDALALGSEGGLPYVVRVGATYALGLGGDPGNAPFLRTLATSKGLDETLRALAVQSLGRVGDRAANAILLEALESPLTQIRRSAAIALGAVANAEDADVIKALTHATEDDADATVRSFAELTLGRIASLGAPSIVERMRKRLVSAPTRQRAFVALALGISGYESALPDLLREFKQESNTSMRGAFAIALALLNNKEAVPELRVAFRHEKEPQLKGYLAWSLGHLGDRDIATDLHELLARESDPQLLYWGAVALGLLGDSTAIGTLQQLYQRDASEQISRASFVHAIGAIGDREAAPFLIGVAKSAKETDVVRAFAAASLGMLCDEDRVPIATAFSRDHNYTLPLTFIPELYYLF